MKQNEKQPNGTATPVPQAKPQAPKKQTSGDQKFDDLIDLFLKKSTPAPAK